MGYDEVLPHLGNFGRYQKRIYFLLCLPAISCAFHKLAGVFLLANPDHRCALPGEWENSSYVISDDLWRLAYPIDTLTKNYSKCEYYKDILLPDSLEIPFKPTDVVDIDYLLDSNTTTTQATTTTVSNAKREIQSCEKWIYDDSKFENSVVTDWNLVCGKSFMRASADSLFMLGVLLGSIVFGHLSDKIGRKPVFIASLVLQLIFGITAGIAPEYFSYSLSRIIVGSTTSGVFLVAYVISMEMVGPDSRLFAGTICMMFFSVGYMLTAVFAYFIHDWRALQIALTLPGVLFLSYWWFIPESARWLLTKNRHREAIDLIQTAAKENNVTVPQDVLDRLIETEIEKKPDGEDDSKPSILDVFRYPNLRRKALLIFFNWFVLSGTYYGLSWNTNNLGNNHLINFVISGAVEIPAYTFIILTLNRFGRRTILAGCMIFGGVVLLLTGFIPSDQELLLVMLTMLGKMAITSGYGTIYVFSAEQFPTVIRNVTLGAASMAARIGGILAPFFILSADIWRPLPMIIFGVLALTGGTLSTLLPETHNKKLPDTIADGEAFGKKDRKVKDVEGHAEELKVLNTISQANGKTRREEEELMKDQANHD